MLRRKILSPAGRELDLPETFFSVTAHFGHVFTGRMGALGRALNVPWDSSMNLAGMFWSAVLRPITNSNFTAFPMSLWAEGRK